MAGSSRKGMQRHGQIVRQWKVLLILDAQHQSLTFAQLRARMSADAAVTERTLRRDIDALTLAGFPIDVTTRIGDDGRVRARVMVLDRSAWRGGARTIFGTADATH